MFNKRSLYNPVTIISFSLQIVQVHPVSGPLAARRCRHHHHHEELDEDADDDVMMRRHAWRCTYK